MPEHCSLLSSFIARQGIIFAAGCIFLLYTWVQIRLGRETRDMRTIAADISKQGGQQAFGGLVMVALGVFLAHDSLDSLAWYGAEYPFEIILTTYFTSKLRVWVEDGFSRWYARRGHAWLEPYTMFGMYGPSPGEFRCDWYGAQLVMAVLLIGIPARIGSVIVILASLELPGLKDYSPVLLVGKLWYHSSLSCTERTIAALYMMPVLGDAVQFIIIDGIQKYKKRDDASLLH
tara:strand:+ start:233 stop:928 length:696 start_codon:yes stop_codon:yes gene_type:complete